MAALPYTAEIVTNTTAHGTPTVPSPTWPATANLPITLTTPTGGGTRITVSIK